MITDLLLLVQVAIPALVELLSGLGLGAAGYSLWKGSRANKLHSMQEILNDAIAEEGAKTGVGALSNAAAKLDALDNAANSVEGVYGGEHLYNPTLPKVTVGFNPLLFLLETTNSMIQRNAAQDRLERLLGLDLSEYGIPRYESTFPNSFNDEDIQPDISATNTQTAAPAPLNPEEPENNGEEKQLEEQLLEQQEETPVQKERKPRNRKKPTQKELLEALQKEVELLRAQQGANPVETPKVPEGAATEQVKTPTTESSSPKTPETSPKSTEPTESGNGTTKKEKGISKLPKAIGRSMKKHPLAWIIGATTIDRITGWPFTKPYKLLTENPNNSNVEPEEQPENELENTKSNDEITPTSNDSLNMIRADVNGKNKNDSVNNKK